MGGGASTAVAPTPGNQPLERKKSFRDRFTEGFSRKRNQQLYASLAQKAVAEQREYDANARSGARKQMQLQLATADGGEDWGGEGNKHSYVRASPQRRLKVIDAADDRVFVTEQAVKPCRRTDSVQIKKPEVAFMATGAVAIRWDPRSAIAAKRVVKYELQCRQTRLEGLASLVGAAEDDGDDYAPPDVVHATSVQRFFCAGARESSQRGAAAKGGPTPPTPQHIQKGKMGSLQKGTFHHGGGAGAGEEEEPDELMSFFECDFDFCTVPLSFYVQETVALFQGLLPANDPSMRPLQFRVRAKTELGWGEWSKVLKRVRGVDPAKLPGPMLSLPPGGGGDSLLVRWDAQTKGQYEVYGRAISHEVFVVDAAAFERQRLVEEGEAVDAAAAAARAEAGDVGPAAAANAARKAGSEAKKLARSRPPSLWRAAGASSCVFSTMLDGYEAMGGTRALAELDYPLLLASGSASPTGGLVGVGDAGTLRESVQGAAAAATRQGFSVSAAAEYGVGSSSPTAAGSAAVLPPEFHTLEYAQVSGGSTLETSFTVRDLKAFETYYIQVMTVRESWQRSRRFKNVFMSEATRMEMPAPIPCTPEAPFVRDAKVDVTDTTILLSWSPPRCASVGPDVVGAEPVSQLLVKRHGGTAPFSEVFKGGGCQFLVGGPGASFLLQPNTAYIFRLVALNEYGQSGRSPPCVISTLPDPFAEQGGAGGAGAAGAGGAHGTGDWASCFLSSTPSSLASLPPGWTEHFDPNSTLTYYYHAESGRNQWSSPQTARDDPLLGFRRRRFKALYRVMRADQQIHAKHARVLAAEVKRELAISALEVAENAVAKAGTGAAAAEEPGVLPVAEAARAADDAEAVVDAATAAAGWAGFGDGLLDSERPLCMRAARQAAALSWQDARALSLPLCVRRQHIVADSLDRFEHFSPPPLTPEFGEPLGEGKSEGEGEGEGTGGAGGGDASSDASGASDGDGKRSGTQARRSEPVCAMCGGACASTLIKRKVKVQFDGERGIDSGGLTKDWYLEVTSRLFARTEIDPIDSGAAAAGSRAATPPSPSPSSPSKTTRDGTRMRTGASSPAREALPPLFAPSSDGHGTFGIAPLARLSPDQCRLLRFFGMVLGKALRDKQLVYCPLESALFGQLLGQDERGPQPPGAQGTVTMTAQLEELKRTDVAMHGSLTWMMNNPIADVLFETFTLSLAGEEVELVPGGADRDVTDENKLEYVQLVLDRRLGRTGATAQAISIMRDGLNEIVPRGLFREFSGEDLALALNGRNTISIDELRPATKYTGGYEDSSPPVQAFWQAMTKFSDEERSGVLRFCTGSARVPLDGFNPPLTITKSEHDDAALPHAHTCFNQLVLPPYTTAESAAKKLLVAVEGTDGFDLT